MRSIRAFRINQLGSRAPTPRHVHTHTSVQVLLVGVLGEDHLTCIDGDLLGFSFSEVLSFSFPEGSTGMEVIVVSIAIVLLVIFCVALLNNEAAQVMAVWTFPGTDFRNGAVVGLVLCVSIPITLLAWRMHIKAEIMRLIDEFPPASDEQPGRA